MSDVWKALRRQNEIENEIREREERISTRAFLSVLPALPAILILTYSDQAQVDLIGQVDWLGNMRDTIGPLFVAYAVVIGYFILIGLLQLGFYWDLGYRTRIVVAWFAWAWFYISTMYLDDLRLAFVVLLVVSLFMVRIVWWLNFCYEKIREGMFFGGRNDT